MAVPWRINKESQSHIFISCLFISYSMSAPPLPVADFSEAKLQKLRALAQQYEIKPELIGKLRVLESFEIIIICDDSGSSK
jgi:hypothetical protein